MKEFKVGERFSVTLEIVEQNSCKCCFFEGADGYIVVQLHLDWSVFQNIVQTKRM